MSLPLLEARGRELSLAVIAEMYRNPFWEERFGERGRAFADEDAGRHVEHLGAALRAGSPTSFIEYALWLRTVLTTRGMCTRHLADNFALLAIFLEREGASSDACEYLRAAERALYDDPLLAQRADLAALVVERIYTAHPEWPGRARCADDVDYHLNYLADAVRNEQPNGFSKYVEFIAGFLERRRVPREHLDSTLAALRQVLEERGLSAAAAVLPQ